VSPDRELIALVGTVAESLAGGWHMEEREDFHSAYLLHDDGRCISVRRDWRNRDRLSVHGNYWTLQEQGRDQGVTLETYGLPVCEIHVSATRGPDVIAREIGRRLLPGYDAGFGDARGRLTASTSAKQGRDATLQQLAAELRVAPSNGGVHWYRNGGGRGSGDFEPDHGGATVSVKLRSIPAALALAIARLLVADGEPQP